MHKMHQSIALCCIGSLKGQATYCNLGVTWGHKGDSSYVKVLEMHKQVLLIVPELGNTAIIGRAYGNVAHAA